MNNQPILQIESIHLISDEDLLQILEGNTVHVEMPCEDRDSQGDEAKAQDYLKALFLGETIAPNCKQITAHEVQTLDSYPNYSIYFTFQPQDCKILGQKLKWLSAYFAEGNDMDIMFEFSEELAEFADNLSILESHFQDLLENYNFLMESNDDQNIDEV